MKKLKVLLAACAIAFGGLSQAMAADWTATELGAGKYYFLNVGASKWWGAGNSWGTQASLLPHPEYLTLEADGTNFKVISQVTSGAKKYFNGSYMDNANPVSLTIETDGTNYSIANGSTYYGYDGSTTVLGTSDSRETDNFKWQIYSHEQMLENLNSATKANPVDATFLILAQGFGRQNNNMNAWTMEAGHKVLGGGDNTNFCTESYHSTFTLTQTLNNVPNGLYKMTAQGFYRQDGSDNENLPYFYINDSKGTFPLMTGTEGGMADASISFTNGNYTTDPIAANVTDGKITLGAKNDVNTTVWCIFDNFVLYYYGPTISTQAIAIPEGGAIEANKWYYFDVISDSEFNIVAENVDNIVYTTDASVLIEDQATITQKFTAGLNTLAKNRYYFKSTSAQTFSAMPNVFTYTIGEATAEGSYIQAGQTISIKYNNISTNNPDAEVTTSLNNILFNGKAVTATPIENGFTFVVPNDVAPSTQYTLSIPAGVIGYEDEVYNEAQELTFTTTLINDGTYYLYDTVKNLFVGRGANYGTEAVVDKYGIPVELKTSQVDNKTTFKFIDNNLYIFHTEDAGGAIYTDNSTRNKWSIEGTKEAFKIKTGDKSIHVGNGDFGYYLNANSVGDEITFTLKTPAERDAIVNGYPANNKTAVIEAAGIETTSADFETYLSENYGVTNVTDKIGTATFSGSAGSWTVTTTREQGNQPAYGANFAEMWQATGSFVQTITAPKAGIYKLTVDGFERRATAATDKALGEAGHNLASAYLDANGQQVRLTDWYSVHKAAGSKDTYPNNTTEAVECFNKGYATNTVYVYLDGKTDLKITLKKNSHVDQCWIVINNFTLTYYAPKATAEEKEALATAIAAKPLGFDKDEYAPYTNIEAAKALSAAKAIDLDEASGEAVVNATNALNDAVWTPNAAEMNAIYWEGYADLEETDKTTPLGWTNRVDNYNTRIIANPSGNTGLTAVNGYALMAKYDTSYGEEAGYTMPLDANSIYKISFKYGGWNDYTSNVTLALKDPNGVSIPLTKTFEAGGNTAIHSESDPSLWYDLTGYFITNEAGDYILTLTKSDKNQKQICIGNLSMVKAEAIEFADGSVPYYAAGTYPSVKITRNLTADRWATAVYPFAVSGIDDIATFEAYDEATATVKIRKATASTANEPFLMRSKTTIAEIVLENVNVVAEAGTPVKTQGNASFVGTYNETDVAKEDGFSKYALSNNTFYIIGANAATVAPYRAYFKVANETSEARSLNFEFDDNTATGIESVNAETTSNGDIYNLNGQKVATPMKGLYIMNGKKIVIK